MSHICALTVVVFVIFLLLGTFGLAQQREPKPSPTFPSQVGVPALEYAGPEEGYPPKIRGISNIRPVISQPIPSPVRASDEEMR
jgi:hypothetical protein